MLNSVDESTLVDITHCVRDDDQASRDMYDRRDEEQAILLEEQLVGYGENDIRSNNVKPIDSTKRRKLILIGTAIFVSVTLVVLLSVFVPGNNISGTNESEIQKSTNTATFIAANTMTSYNDSFTSINETDILPNKTLTGNLEDIDSMFTIATASPDNSSSPITDSNSSDYEDSITSSWWQDKEEEEQEIPDVPKNSAYEDSFTSNWWQSKEEEEQELPDIPKNNDRDQQLDTDGVIIVDIDTIASQNYEKPHVGDHPVSTSTKPSNKPTIDPIKRPTVVQQDNGVIIVDIDTITSSYEAVTDEAKKTRSSQPSRKPSLKPTSNPPSRSPTDRPTRPLIRNPTKNPTKIPHEDESNNGINITSFERPGTPGSESYQNNEPNEKGSISIHSSTFERPEASGSGPNLTKIPNEVESNNDVNIVSVERPDTPGSESYPISEPNEEESINIHLSTFERPDISGPGSFPDRPNEEKSSHANSVDFGRPESSFSFSQIPTFTPSKEPKKVPTKEPTKIPSRAPSKKPTKRPTITPTERSATPTSDATTFNPTNPTSTYPTPIPLPTFPTISPTTWLPTATHPPTNYYPWEHGIFEEGKVQTPTVTPVPTTLYPTVKPWPTVSPTTWLPTNTFSPTVA